MHDRTLALLKSVERDGMNDLIDFLESSDFFTAPCSTKYHLAKKGGLVEHSLNVFDAANRLNEQYAMLYPRESIIIAAICHDLCKVQTYKEVHEDPTDPQLRYLTSLCTKHGIKKPEKLNKAYTGILIDFLLKEYKPGALLPEFTLNYQIEDQLPLGHGEKSLAITQQYIALTSDEMLAIRWHLGAYEVGTNFGYPTGYAYKAAVEKSKLVTMLIIADAEATFLMEA